MDAQTPPNPSVDALERFVRYPFADDADYQQGLTGILTSGALEGKSKEEMEEVVLQSQVFYFNRISGLSLNVDEAREAKRSDSNRKPATASTPPASQRPVEHQDSKPLTFAQLKELIERGMTDDIPNNKVIPNVLSSESPSESKATVRKKPWEVGATA